MRHVPSWQQREDRRDAFIIATVCFVGMIVFATLWQRASGQAELSHRAMVRAYSVLTDEQKQQLATEAEREAVERWKAAEHERAMR